MVLAKAKMFGEKIIKMYTHRLVLF